MRKEFLVLAGLFVVAALFAGMTSALTTTATVTVAGTISITLSAGAPITFTSVTPGVTAQASSSAPLNVSVDPITNEKIDILVNGQSDPFLCTNVAGSVSCNAGGITLPLLNLKWKSGANSGSYTTTAAKVCADLIWSNNCMINHTIDAPANLPIGSYAANIIVSAATSAT